MKRIGLMTWYSNGNYGTMAQAFALKSVLSKFGQCEIIPYKSEKRKDKLQDIFVRELRHKLYVRIYEKLLYLLFSKKIAKKEQLKKEKMKDFFENSLDISKDRITKNSLKKVEEKFDYFVCGSDQIWNPNHFDSSFFLDFVNPPRKLIAYAPSFGVQSVNNLKERTSEIQKLIERFDCLSAREKQGQKIIYDLIGKQVPVCVDPTLLLSRNEWEHVIDSNSTPEINADIYCLFLGNYRKHKTSLNKISEYLNLPLSLHTYNSYDYFFNGRTIEGLSLFEFINTIRNSKFVCTDSFHATIFAIIFNKPFITFRRFNPSDENSQNSRVESLLDVTGLYDRLDMSPINAEQLLLVDFERAEKWISETRKLSIRYLEKALGEY